MESQIRILKNKVQRQQEKIESLESDIKNLEEVVAKIHNQIYEPVAEIKILEKNGEWGDFTGNFTFDPEIKRETIIEIVKNHFNRRKFRELFPQQKFAIFLRDRTKKDSYREIIELN